MPSPFPGMDPYLERPDLWPDVHLSLIIALRDALSPLVSPRYYVAVEERIYLVEAEAERLVGEPDVAVVGWREPARGSADAASRAGLSPVVEVLLPEPDEHLVYLEVRDPEGDEVITAIEILSHTNKRPGKGRQAYEAKRREILGSFTTLVEIDLLRSHPPMEMRFVENGGDLKDYRIMVSRYEQRPRADLYAFSVRDPIPAFPVPLRPGEPEPSISLKPLLDEIYERASYGRRVNYRQPLRPGLSEADAEWASALLREQHLK